MCVYDNVIFFCFDDNADNRDNFRKRNMRFLGGQCLFRCRSFMLFPSELIISSVFWSK